MPGRFLSKRGSLSAKPRGRRRGKMPQCEAKMIKKGNQAPGEGKGTV